MGYEKSNYKKLAELKEYCLEFLESRGVDEFSLDLVFDGIAIRFIYSHSPTKRILLLAGNIIDEKKKINYVTLSKETHFFALSKVKPQIVAELNRVSKLPKAE